MNSRVPWAFILDMERTCIIENEIFNTDHIIKIQIKRWVETSVGEDGDENAMQSRYLFITRTRFWQIAGEQNPLLCSIVFMS